MSIQKYKKARELINNAGGGDFEGAKPESLVVEAESALGLVFPPSYRSFILEMGCGAINGLEVFGLINNNFETSTVPNAIWLTLNERRGIGLHPSYVLIGEGGDGTFYALDTKQLDSEGEALVIQLSPDGKQSEKISDSFGSYFFEAVRNAI